MDSHLRDALANAVRERMAVLDLTPHGASLHAQMSYPTFRRVLKGSSDPRGLRLATFAEAADWAGVRLDLVAADR